MRLGDEQEKAYNAVLNKYMYAYDFFQLYTELQKVCINPVLLNLDKTGSFKVRDCSKVVYLLNQLKKLIHIDPDQLNTVLDDDISTSLLESDADE